MPLWVKPSSTAAFESTSQPHVDEFGAPLRSHDDVRWLDVAMDHAPLGGVNQGTCDLKREVDRRADRERTAALDPLANRRAFNILESDIVISIVMSDRVDPSDVLVVEPGRRTSS